VLSSISPASKEVHVLFDKHCMSHSHSTAVASRCNTVVLHN